MTGTTPGGGSVSAEERSIKEPPPSLCLPHSSRASSTMSAIKVFSILAIAFTLAVVLEALPQKDLSAKYENLDVEAILKNKRTLNSYIKCVLDKGPCTPEGRDLKENISKNLETKCAECTPRQKQIVRKASKYVMKNNPDDWQEIVHHYDPENKYIKGFIEFLNLDD